MTLDAFASLLKEAIGLEAASIGLPAIERAVQQRVLACGLADLPAYWEKLSGSAAELQALVEAVVVPETWFFRDREAFAALSGVVLYEWLQHNPQRRLRLLSLPCSTGEEPYSMAMALLDAGLPAERFEIDAVDVSARALEHARAGVYGANSFRAADLNFRERHFERVAAGWRVAERVRRPVTFRQGNVLTAQVSADGYDVIFCRNVFIYFDRTTQARVVATLERMLVPGGFLFVGPSETALLSGREFISARLPFSFAFRRITPGSRRAMPAAPPVPARPTRAPRPKQVAPMPAPRPVVRAAQAAPAASDARNELEHAQRLADEGRLTDAIASCEEHLRRHGPSADVFHLLGLAHDAAGAGPQAVECYRKALYLEPHHEQAALHLALLLERQGDRHGAEVLRQRARVPLRGAGR